VDLGELPELCAEISRRGSVLGEITIVIEGAGTTVEWSVEEIVQAALEESSGSSRDLAREIAGRTGLSRKDVYAEILRQRQK
jgi:16S rRNA C1402 (ribose-2'-O) methylase RsmI